MDLGYRSIQINIVNDTNTDLIIYATLDAGWDWIDNMQPEKNVIISEHTSMALGCKTADMNAPGCLSFHLTGIGKTPILISVCMDANSVAEVQIVDSMLTSHPVSEVASAAVTQLTAAGENHAVFIARIIVKKG